MLLPRTALCLLLCACVLAAPTAQELASDGSGMTASYTKRSAPVLIWSISLLLIGLFLLAYCKRGWRVTTGIGFGLVAALAAWGILVAAMPANRVYTGSVIVSDLIIAIVTMSIFLLFAFIGIIWAWPLGIVCLGASGGFSFGLSVCLMAQDAIFEQDWARYVFLGVLTIVGVLVVVILLNYAIVPLGTMCGAFCLFLAIDLLSNEENGLSRGLRFILDSNSSHQPGLAFYQPRLSSRIFIALMWAFAVICAATQFYLFRGKFIPPKRKAIPVSNEKRISTVSAVSTTPSSVVIPIQNHDMPPEVDEEQDVESLHSIHSASSISHSMFSAITQQVRQEWSGALSQYSSMTDLASRRSSIMRPFRVYDDEDVPPPLPRLRVMNE